MSEKTAQHTYEEGLTAVELLITLFIAAVFIFAGYQLYTQVSRESVDADKMAKISNEAYKRMRENAAAVSANNPAGCVSGGSVTYPATTYSNDVPIAGFKDVDFTITISCPYGSTTANASDLFLVTVETSYDDGSANRKTLKHAIYTN